MSRPRILFSLAVLICLMGTSQHMAQDNQLPPLRPRLMQDGSGRFRGSINSSETYASVLTQVLPKISQNYHFQVISENALAGRALLGLYQTAGQIAPEALVRDPDHYFDRAPGANLQDKIKRARDAVNEVPAIRAERGFHASFRAVFQSLDVFSNYSEVDTNTRRIYETGDDIGLFLEDKPLGGSYFVRNIEIDSPAHKQGLRPGDELLGIDNHPITPNMTTAQVNAMITISARKRAGVKLTVRNLHGEKKLIEVSSVTPGIDNIELVNRFTDVDRETPILGFRPLGDGDWDFWVDRSSRIGLLRLGTIQLSISKLYEIVGQLQEDGLKGLIIDLRDCPSGYPESSAELAGFFLEEKKLIARTNYRNPEADDFNRGEPKKEFVAKPIDFKRCLDTRLAVLIGPDTSGAAELIAAALQDHHRATLIGQRSRGKSTIQQVNREQTIFQYSYRLTVGVFVRPSGKNLHRSPGSTMDDDWGVRPDVEVILPAQMRRQVRAWWFEHDTRSPDSLEPTQIDNLKNDPVLQTAVNLLKK